MFMREMWFEAGQLVHPLAGEALLLFDQGQDGVGFRGSYPKIAYPSNPDGMRKSEHLNIE
jgi:hypothetical protein